MSLNQLNPLFRLAGDTHADADEIADMFDKAKEREKTGADNTGVDLEAGGIG